MNQNKIKILKEWRSSLPEKMGCLIVDVCTIVFDPLKTIDSLLYQLEYTRSELIFNLTEHHLYKIQNALIKSESNEQ